MNKIQSNIDQFANFFHLQLKPLKKHLAPPPLSTLYQKSSASISGWLGGWGEFVKNSAETLTAVSVVLFDIKSGRTLVFLTMMAA